MAPIAIVVPSVTPRLQYICDWLFREQLAVSYDIITSVTEYAASDRLVLSYGGITGHSLSMPASGLISEAGIDPKELHIGTWHDMPILFETKEQGFTIPFDLFSALFYLISRYEEYYDYTPDKHSRYPATESILYKMNCLERPLADEWVAAFRRLLESHGVQCAKPSFQWLPTYDIDIAWSYRHKGLWRNMGGCLKDIAAGRLKEALLRARVLTGLAGDPFDSFDFLDKLHHSYGVKPVYFILSALQTGSFDKNISPLHPQMQQLVRKLSSSAQVGLHPSYHTDRDNDRLAAEKKALEMVLGKTITQSRQHYIRSILPGTYRQLSAAGITHDYSMGYATHLGFRAGTAHSFPWYDLLQESATGLRITPFCFMDATAHYELQLSAPEAFDRLYEMSSTLQQTGGTLTTVFHNFSLGTAQEWDGWKELYEQLFRRVYTKE